MKLWKQIYRNVICKTIKQTNINEMEDLNYCRMCMCLCMLGCFIMTVRKVLPFKISNPLTICNQIWDLKKILFEI
jgi:hypothetical protein